MKKLLTLFIFTFAFSGCAELTKTAELTSSAIIVDRTIMTGAAVDMITSAKVTPEEAQTLREAIAYYNDFRNKWAGELKSSIMQPLAFDVFTLDFDILTSHYQNVVDIVENHQTEYSSVELTILKRYQAEAERFGDSTRSFINQGDRIRAITSALEIGKLIARIFVL